MGGLRCRKRCPYPRCHSSCSPGLAGNCFKSGYGCRKTKDVNSRPQQLSVMEMRLQEIVARILVARAIQCDRGAPSAYDLLPLLRHARLTAFASGLAQMAPLCSKGVPYADSGLK
jgi:hypothetical protein